jgi:hypothetical protein
MLQTRPSSASGMLQTVPVQSSGSYTSGSSQRNSIHAVTAPVVYRGSSAPVQPYAFTSTPSLNMSTQGQQTRSHRTSSSPAVPTIQTLDYLQSTAVRSKYSASVSMTNLPSTGTVGQQTSASTRDDFALSGARRVTSAPRPSQPNGTVLPPSASTGPVRGQPERYRRSALRSSDPQGVISASVTTAGVNASNARNGPHHSATHQLRVLNAPPLNRPNSFVGTFSGSAIDDMALPRSQSSEEIKRTRRRSMPALDSAGFLTPPQLKQPEESIRPKSTDKDDKPAKAGDPLSVGKTNNDNRVGSSDSRSSGRSSRSSSVSNQLSPLRAALRTHPTGSPVALHR